jgi:hypothetical protein
MRRGEIGLQGEGLAEKLMEAPCARILAVSLDRAAGSETKSVNGSFGRVAAERAIIRCYNLSIQGRDHLHRLSPSVA